MNKFRACLLLCLILLPVPKLHAQLKPLGIEDIQSWNKITEKVVSTDGRWIAYKIEPHEGDSKIYLCNNQGETLCEHDCGTRIRFTDDSQFMLFTIRPMLEHVRQLKRQSVKKDDLPKDGLGIYTLGKRSLDTIDNVKSYKIPKHGASWLAYQVENQKDKGRVGHNGFSLHLRNLETGENRTWPLVTQYQFTENGRRLFFASRGSDKDMKAGLYFFDLHTKRVHRIMTGDYDYQKITSSSTGDSLAFLCRPHSESKPGDVDLYLWAMIGNAKKIVDGHDKRFPKNWRISEYGRLQFSDDENRIFFGIAPIRSKRDPAILDEQWPDVDVWHGSEGLLHTVQLVQRNRELRRTYRTMYDLRDDKLMQIETLAVPQSTLLDRGDSNHVLLYTSKPYELESMWDPMHYDFYLLDLTNGTRRTVLKDTRSRVRPSPSGKYLAWFDYTDYSYYTYNINSGTKHRITKPSIIRADEERNTTFDYNSPYGSPGWLDDDRAMLVYDRYDVWKVDPANRTRPVNLTVTGRKSKTIYRLIQFDKSRPSFSDKQAQYLTGFNEISRATGYYRASLARPAVPQRLLGGAYRLSTPLKARDADTVVYTKETFRMFPDLIVSDLSFEKNTRLSNANPQQADFRWGTAELCHWTSLDGQPLDGLLYKPENFDPSKKYPMIVQFFHKSSDQLYNHRTPEFHRSRIDYHYFVSNGYVVFNPDIYFDDGYIGESAYKSIMPGVTSLIDKGFIDPKRIGAQGHSYSGYQVAYLITRTNMFACVEAGAPVVNFFSAYGGIRWETGRNRAAQYEHDQTLATIWESPLRFLENSPLFAMDKVTTPVLILHNDHDGAVPWYQGIEFFIALRRMQKPVWLINYNGEGHCLKQFKNKKDFQIRQSQFFGHYLKGQPMPRWMKKGVPAVDKDHRLGYERARE